MNKQAKLLFDSAVAGDALGTRGFGATQRSLLYGTGDVNVDVMLVDGGCDLKIVQGQVARGHPGEPVCGVRVQLGDSDATTDEYGQFSVTLMGAQAVTLRIRMGEIGIDCRLPNQQAVA